MVISSAGRIATAAVLLSTLLDGAGVDAQLTSVEFEVSTLATSVGDAAGVQAFRLADVNRDDRDDLVAIDRARSKVLVYLAEEDGSFAEPRDFDVLVGGDPEEPTCVAVGDVGSPFASQGNGDADGNADIVVGTEDGSVAILVGDGTGGFASRDEQIDPGVEIVGVQLATMNGDAALDVVVLDASDGIFVLRNEDGSFNPDADQFDTDGDDPIDLDVADIDANAGLDVVVLHRNTKTVALLLGDGNGGLGPPTLRSTVSDPSDDDQTPTDLAVADLDDDGAVDVALVNSGQFGDLQMLVRRGPDLRDQSTYPGPFGLRGLTIANFDDDSFPDAVLVSETGGDGGVFLGDDGGAGGFLDVGGFVIRGIPASRAVASGDIDDDGRIDFVSLNVAGNAFSVALNQGVVDTSSPTVPTATITPTPDPTAVGPTVTGTPGATGTTAPTVPVPGGSGDDDSCAIVASRATTTSGWILLLPPALLLWRRRVTRASTLG